MPAQSSRSAAVTDRKWRRGAHEARRTPQRDLRRNQTHVPAPRWTSAEAEKMAAQCGVVRPNEIASLFREAPKNTILNRSNNDRPNGSYSRAAPRRSQTPQLRLRFVSRVRMARPVKVSKTVNDGPGTTTTYEPRMDDTMTVAATAVAERGWLRGHRTPVPVLITQ